jgi:hypothetical protein
MWDRLGELDKYREVDKNREMGKTREMDTTHPMVHMDRAETIDDYNRDDDT